MRFLKRLAGVLMILLGCVGVLGCLVGLVGTWVVRARIDTGVRNVEARLDTALSKLGERTSQANERVDGIRDSCHRLNQRVQERLAELRDVPTAEAPDIDEIERQVRARIQLGRDWIGFVRTGVDLVEQLLEMLNSASLFVQQETKTRAEIVAAVRAGQREIDEALQLADEVGIQLENVRAHRDLDESAARIETLSSRIDASLQNVQRFGGDLEVGIAQTRTDVGDLGSRIRRKLLIFTAIVNLLLLWLAASQVSLATHGWRCLSFRAA